ncbi:hypothetical protein N3K66_009061 [Trichothecium roseum]|uniref:Uncharacterized protein n=1 Tax=Trichothecium roseum TaxID=47278 RepID=A0ACC0UR45_9HYPO|nr:hypothetical protein N3K66_009061 [Trichothecium roseum]
MKRTIPQPLETIKDVLDLGTGNGRWAVEFADENKNAINLILEVDDIEQDWNRKAKFDLIHARNLNGGIRWQHIIESSYRYLRPGGQLIIENFEYPFSSAGNLEKFKRSYLYAWSSEVERAARKNARPFETISTLQNMLEKTGFQMEVSIEELPIGAWPEDAEQRSIGLGVKKFLNESFEGHSLFLLSEYGGYEEEDATLLCALARQNLSDETLRGVLKWHRIIATKLPSTL